MAKQKDPFWTSFSDLMTSLFFVMLVLFIICLIKVGKANSDLREAMGALQETLGTLEETLGTANADKERLEQILQLDSLYDKLSKESTLGYDTEKKMFYAKAFVGKEIFYPNDDKIKEEYLAMVDSVGNDLARILKVLYNDSFHYQLVIEGNAAIKWSQLKAKSYDPDNKEMYYLSYRRALALYNRWRIVGKHDFRRYNTEIVIAGSGFNGNNRDMEVEENNKRFIIQILPKINRPDVHGQIHSVSTQSQGSIAAASSVSHMRIEHEMGLTVYFPHSYTIDLVCGERPSETDSNIIYCAEAAFTEKCLDKFDHYNIAGNHVSGGTLYRGYPCEPNTGAFVFYNGRWKFLYDTYAGELKIAAQNGGMGFGQNMIIFNGTAKSLFLKDKTLNIYRALCETDKGSLCIVESDSELRYSDFVKRLSAVHIQHALYLDMGAGWNYSWYRDAQNQLHVLHPKKHNTKYQTNWIVFRKRSK